MAFFNDVDAREELELILEENKIDVLYVRSNTRTRCKCYDPLHKDGNSNCKICRGTGLIPSIEKMEVFCNPTSMDDAIRLSGQKRTELGDANVMTQTFYLKHNERPKSGDRVLIVGYDKYNLPTEVKESSIVSVPREVRGYHGRVEMNKIICRTSPQMLEKDQKRLNSIPNKDKIKLMKGVRYQWGN